PGSSARRWLRRRRLGPDLEGRQADGRAYDRPTSTDRDPCAAPSSGGHSMTTEQQQAPASESGAPTTYKMVIGGESVEAADGQTFDVINPATGKVVARAPLRGREDVDRAVTAGQKAFEDRKGWATWAAGKRGRTLAKFAALVKQHTEELAQLETANVGQRITAARGGRTRG